MSVKYDVVAITGTYTNAQGEEKKRYQRIGVILTTKSGGYMLRVESIPVGWDGAAFLNDPREREDGKDAKPAAKPRAAKPAPTDDDIPF